MQFVTIGFPVNHVQTKLTVFDPMHKMSHCELQHATIPAQKGAYGKQDDNQKLHELKTQLSMHISQLAQQYSSTTTKTGAYDLLEHVWHHVLQVLCCVASLSKLSDW